MEKYTLRLGMKSGEKVSWQIQTNDKKAFLSELYENFDKLGGFIGVNGADGSVLVKCSEIEYIVLSPTLPEE